MNNKIKMLVDKFIIETDMDDVEVEEFNDQFYLCNDIRQLGEIHKINNEYCIYLQDKYLKGKKFNSKGWC